MQKTAFEELESALTLAPKEFEAKFLKIHPKSVTKS